MKTTDHTVRAQIATVMTYLRGEGFQEIHDLLTRTSEGYHTIRSTINGQPRLLRLGYVWLEEHPADAVTWLQGQGIVDRLKSDNPAPEIWIRDDGQITSGLTPR